jgi:hypothetical protein
MTKRYVRRFSSQEIKQRSAFIYNQGQELTLRQNVSRISFIIVPMQAPATKNFLSSSLTLQQIGLMCMSATFFQASCNIFKQGRGAFTAPS